MNENESIHDMITKFTKITNRLSSLGGSINNDQKVRKVIRAFPSSWEEKSTTLKGFNDKEEMNFIGLIVNSKTHEIKRKVRKEKAPKKR